MTKNKNLSWRDAVIYVLRKAKKAMHYADIADLIVANKLRDEVGATPANSVSTAIHISLKNDKKKSPFLKVSPGEFMLREEVEVSEVGSLPTSKKFETKEEEPEESVGIIQAFGMFWRRGMINWKKDPKFYGQQQREATLVDFCNQRGVYLLHDGRDIIYVGRTTDQPLGQRLLQHTFDRLTTRWNRFSWFGILEVTEKGALKNGETNGLTTDVIIATMEAILIEGLEPPQNRKRGDEFRAVEYIQAEDPEIQKKLKAKMFEEMKADFLK